jgi:hypothetical protein
MKPEPTPEWQAGVPPFLLNAVAEHRRLFPTQPLPADLQRELAKAWLRNASNGTRTTQ